MPYQQVDPRNFDFLGRYMQGQQQARENKMQDQQVGHQNALLDMRQKEFDAQQAQNARLTARQDQQWALEDEATKSKRIVASTEWLMQSLDSGQPIDMNSAPPEVLRSVEEMSAAFRQNGADISQLSPEQLKQVLSGAHAKHAAMLGQGPPQPQDPGPLQEFIDPNTGKPIYGSRGQAMGQQAYHAPQAPQQPPVQFLDDKGNPVWGTREQALGRTPVPPASSQPKPLSPKDKAAASTKLTLIQQAKKQLQLVKQRIKEAKGYSSGGYWGAQSLIPSEKGKLLDGAVDSMRNIITSLTRTPGIGANSDFETRLQQAQLPSRGDREAVQDQKAQSIQDLLDALDGGYSEIISPQDSPVAQQPDGDWKDL
jgi:hypothetical protein